MQLYLVLLDKAFNCETQFRRIVCQNGYFRAPIDQVSILPQILQIALAVIGSQALFFTQIVLAMTVDIRQAEQIFFVQNSFAMQI